MTYLLLPLLGFRGLYTVEDVGAGEDMDCGVKLISDELVEDEDDIGRAVDEKAG